MRLPGLTEPSDTHRKIKDMTNSTDQMRECLYRRAKKEEDAWREERGLSKELYRTDNAAAARRRKRAMSPAEPRANARHRRWKAQAAGQARRSVQGSTHRPVHGRSRAKQIAAIGQC